MLGLNQMNLRFPRLAGNSGRAQLMKEMSSGDWCPSEQAPELQGGSFWRVINEWGRPLVAFPSQIIIPGQCIFWCSRNWSGSFVLHQNGILSVDTLLRGSCALISSNAHFRGMLLLSIDTMLYSGKSLILDHFERAHWVKASAVIDWTEPRPTTNTPPFYHRLPNNQCQACKEFTPAIGISGSKWPLIVHCVALIHQGHAVDPVEHPFDRFASQLSCMGNTGTALIMVTPVSWHVCK